MNKSFLISLILVILCSCAISPQNVPELYKQNLSSIVTIFISKTNYFTGKTQIKYNGSGFIINKRLGLIITAAHVVPNKKICEIELWQNEKRIQGKILSTNLVDDIAIIKVNPNLLRNRFIRDLKFELAPKIGESLFCIGTPGGYRGTISFGILSTGLITEIDVRSSRPRHYYLSDIHIFGGSSGSPTFNFENKIVGMVVQYCESYTLMIPAVSINDYLRRIK